jgi:flagellar hook-associated protein 2
MITQLMQVEAAPQTRLKSKVSTAQTAVASYQSVNSKVASLKTAGDALSQLSTWRAVKATSSSTSVTATAVTGTNGSAGTTAFDVFSLAKSQISSAKVPVTGDATTADTFDVTIAPLDGSATGTTKTITLGTDKSAQGIADAINAAGIGVKAAVVTTGGSQNILQFSGTKTGAANAFAFSGLDGVATNNVAEASNAVLKIGGGEENGGYDVTSDTNTFSKLMPGVSLTVSKIETGVTVTSQQDVSGMAGKIQALVDAANNALSEIGTQTAYDSSTNKGSPLTGDFAVRNMSQTILSTVSKGLSYDNPDYDSNQPTDKSTGTNLEKISMSLAKLGVQLDSTGRLTFNADKFTASYNADPTAIQKAGIALGDEFESISGTMTKNLTSVITGRNSEIDRLNSQIDNWDLRLSAKKLALQKQYSDLEVSLGKLKNQSSWLSGQLAGLS